MDVSGVEIKRRMSSGLEHFRWAKGLMASAKRSGDRGQPCLIPWHT